MKRLGIILAVIVINIIGITVATAGGGAPEPSRQVCDTLCQAHNQQQQDAEDAHRDINP